jgi:hypothetical protein
MAISSPDRNMVPDHQSADCSLVEDLPADRIPDKLNKPDHYRRSVAARMLVMANSRRQIVNRWLLIGGC